MLAEQAHELNVICHDYGKVRHYRSDYAVPGKACARSNKPAGEMKAGSRGGRREMWCTVHQTTTRMDSECEELRAYTRVARTRSR